MLTLTVKILWWLVRLPLSLLVWAIDRLRRRPLILDLVLEGAHPERPAARRLMQRGAEGLTRAELRTALRRAARDPRVRQVRVRIGPIEGGWGEAWSLRRMLSDARAADLRIQAYLAHGDLKALWVASAAHEVIAPPHEPVYAAGVAAEMTFFAGALTHLGVEVEAIAAGEYKSAMEPFTRTQPSAPNREAVEALLDDFDGRVVADLAEARGLSEAAVRAAFAQAPLSASAALDAGLVDRLAAEDEVYDPEAKDRTVDAANYGGRPRPWPRLRLRRPRLAVIDLRGTIRDGRHLDPAPTGAVPRAIIGALERARRSRRIKGVLLAIDSPGGSATASEAMWRAVQRLAGQKPVIAVMGNVAASGGYYVAAACHGIVAAPTTLTGSIGVISARPTAQGLLNRLGLHQTRLGPGARAHVFSPGKRLSQGERVALKGLVRDFYTLFLARVAAGRGQPTEAIEPLAEGRVWSGQQALDCGLVDRLGDETDAIAWLAERAGLARPPRALTVISPRRSLVAQVRARLGAQAAASDAVAGALGAALPGGREALGALQLMADSPLLAWCPWRIR